MTRRTILAIAAMVLAGGGLVWLSAPNDHDHSRHHAAAHNVKVPALSPAAQQGETLFNAQCAQCHGKNAAGTENGPPLVHKIYEPSHHSDLSFQRAAKFGVRAHHWSFGNMPPVAGITETEVDRVITYVRTLQRANGIQ